MNSNGKTWMEEVEIGRLTYPEATSIDPDKIREITRLNKVKAYMSRESGRLFLCREDVVKVELLKRAVNQLRGKPSRIQRKAIWIWAKHVKTGEGISFREAEEKAMEELGISPPTEASRSPGGRGGD